MSGLLAFLSARNKALMALVAGALNWGYFVVDSPSKAITAQEWLLLAGVGAAAVGVHQIANTAPAPVAPAVVAPVPGDTHYSAPPGAVVGAKPPE